MEKTVGAALPFLATEIEFRHHKVHGARPGPDKTYVSCINLVCVSSEPLSYAAVSIV